MQESICAVILAAGLGKRMKSDKAKVLHEICGRSMIQYVVDTARNVVGNNIVVVVGHQAEKVKEKLDYIPELKFAYQEKQLGTGHAVACALPLIPEKWAHVVIMCGDVPLLTSDTVLGLVRHHLMQHNDLTILSIELEDSKGYGRIIMDSKGNVEKIVEEADASDSQKQIKLINTGLYCVKLKFLKHALSYLNSRNNQNEFYLTDIVEIGYRSDFLIGVFSGSSIEETLGVNCSDDLLTAKYVMQKRIGEKP